MHNLPMQITQLNPIVIKQTKSPNTSTSKIQRSRRSQTTKTDDQDFGSGNALLAGE